MDLMLNESEKVLENFPSNYSYLLQESEGNFLKFRIKEVTEETSVRKWIADFSISTKTTWRISRTHPAAGKCNLFRLDLRCEHATDKRAIGLKPSKNTDCPATLTIIVKRYVKASRSKYVDPLIKDWPTICCMKYQHNHKIGWSAAPRYKHLHPYLYLEQNLHVYNADVDEEENINENNEDLNINITNKNDLERNEDFPSSSAAAISVNNDENEFHSEILTDNELVELDALFNGIKNCYKEKPKIFAPAIRKMLKNAKQFAATQNGLVSALCTFGFCNATGKRKCKQNKYGQSMEEQLTSVTREKSLLSGKRKLSSDPPTNIVKRTKPCVVYVNQL